MSGAYSPDTPDPFDDFLAQFLAEFTLTVTTSPPPSSSSPVAAPAAVAHHAHDDDLTCQWVTASPLVCGAPLSADPEHVRAHLRYIHDVRGNEKALIACCWHDCEVPPMRRGSLMRHVLAVHLGLLRWQCDTCGKVLSRRAGHACVVSSDGA